jgi:hypothetical protein
MTRPITNAGHIAYGRNRFCGADVFDTLARAVSTPSDLLILSFGGRALDDGDREVLRCVSLAVTSPDARVWPLKLTRVLASHGNLFASFHGAQLANLTDRIGPNAATSCARALAAIGERVEDPADTARLDEEIARFLESRPTVGGFGVPFREEDERLVELERLLAGHAITRRKPWLISQGLARAMRARHGIRPNVVSALASIILDLGIAPHRAGLFVGVMMTHTYAAHALEACDRDSGLLRELDFTRHVEYRGRAPRRVPR